MSDQISVDKIKPSPYQPRLIFDLEDIRGSIQKDAILVALTVRKKDGFYELVDGERRLRLAKELGYKTVPCTVIEVDDQTARRMVYKVNKQRKNYTPEEEATFFKKLVEEERMKPREIETELRVDHHWVQACLNVWKFPEEIRENILGSRPHVPYRLYMTDVRDLEAVINRNVDEAIAITKELIDKRMTPAEKRETIGRWEKRIDEETIKATQEALKKTAPIPEEVKLETPDDLEKAAEAFKHEAKRKRESKLTLEEKAKRETEKQRKKEEAKRKAEEKKRKEEEKRRKHEEELREKLEKEAKKKAKQELLKDKEFLAEAAKLARIEETMEVIRTVELTPKITPKELKAFTESVEEYENKLKELLNSDVVKERGHLFRNWFGHAKTLELLHTTTCPVCGSSSNNVEWACHHVKLSEAEKVLREKYQKSLEVS